MDLKAVGVVFLILGVAQCTDEFISGHNFTDTAMSTNKYSTFIDMMIDEISGQQWKENELQCQEQILDILRNVQNSTLWAMWIWNSMQLPTGQFFGARTHFGNFDQCLRKLWDDDPVPTQYCLVEVQLTDTDDHKGFHNVNAYDSAASYLSIKTKYDFILNGMAWGVCTPAVCSERSVKRFASTLLRLSHMGTITEHPQIEVEGCQQTHIPPDYTNGLYVLPITAVILVITGFVCTYISNQKSSKDHPKSMTIIKCFDLKSNMMNLLVVNENDIKMMHGVRSLTSCIVILLHALFIHLMSSPSNGLDMNKDFEFYAKFLSHTSVLVDSFFMMSGLLLMTSFKPDTGRMISPFKVLIKRYFRFIWFFIVMIIATVTVTPYLLGGPLWVKYGKREKETCEKNWWLSLLMLNNYVGREDMCIQVSWSIPADYHMAVVSVFLYWFYQRNRLGGLYLFGFLATASVLLPGIYTYVNELEAIAAFRFKSLTDTRNSILIPLYAHTHLRASPYFVGLAAGYILSLYKPANYRNIISKKYTMLCFFTILVLCTSILLLGPLFLLWEYNALHSALFVAINRPLWAALSAAFIMICEYGTMPIIPDLLRWSGFVLVSKLSFGMYLCQYIFILRMAMPLRTQSWHEQLKIFQDSLGLLAIVILVSLLVALFLELPLNNITNLLIIMKPQPQNQVNETPKKTAAKFKNFYAKNNLEVSFNNNCSHERIDRTNGIRTTNSHLYLSDDTVKKDI